MSTRSYIGVGPLEKFKGFYVHSDGYPDAKIPLLVAWLWKNGYQQFVRAVDNTRGAGGSSLDGSLDPNSLVEPAYDDGPDEHVLGREEAMDQEYTYVVMKDRIDVFNWGDYLGSVRWKNGERAAIKFVFNNTLKWTVIEDGLYYIIGYGVYKESGL